MWLFKACLLVSEILSTEHHGLLHQVRWGNSWELCGVCQSFRCRVNSWENGRQDDQDTGGWVIDCRGDSFLKDFLFSLKGINCCNLVDLYEHNIQSGSRAFRWVHLSRAALGYLLCLEMARMRRLLSVLCFMMLGRWCLLFVMGRLVIFGCFLTLL